MTKKYKTPEDSTPMVEEPTVAYNVSSTCGVPVNTLPAQERIILTEEMEASLHKAEQNLINGNCLTEENFQARFAKWLYV